ncbi:MAG: DUF3793 family protein [bacterium]
MNLEKLIIQHAAPTLANLKTANLINITFDNLDSFYDEIYKIKNTLEDKCINLEILKLKQNSALVYIYRSNLLMKDLRNNISNSILISTGYKCNTISQYLTKLSERLLLDDFPHEIGLFLGYPPDDVKAFIDNNGKCAVCCGYWKAYNNVTTALNTFKKYDMCRKSYLEHFNINKNLNILIV